MKAKEYAELVRLKLDETDDHTAIAIWLVKEMHKEALALGMRRCGKPKPPDNVMLPVLKEFDLKWRAIANLVDWLQPNGWRDVLKDNGITL